VDLGKKKELKMKNRSWNTCPQVSPEKNEGGKGPSLVVARSRRKITIEKETLVKKRNRRKTRETVGEVSAEQGGPFRALIGETDSLHRTKGNWWSWKARE